MWWSSHHSMLIAMFFMSSILMSSTPRNLFWCCYGSLVHFDVVVIATFHIGVSINIVASYMPIIALIDHENCTINHIDVALNSNGKRKFVVNLSWSLINVQKILPSIVHLIQYEFIVGRDILCNILNVQMIVDYTLQGNSTLDAPTRRVVDATRLYVHLDYGVCRNGT